MFRMAGEPEKDSLCSTWAGKTAVVSSFSAGGTSASCEACRMMQERGRVLVQLHHVSGGLRCGHLQAQ